MRTRCRIRRMRVDGSRIRKEKVIEDNTEGTDLCYKNQNNKILKKGITDY